MSNSKLEILITSGGTKEPIDGVRFIANVSTGATGAALAHELAMRGHSITLVHAVGSVMPVANPEINLIEYITFQDLQDRISSCLEAKSYDAIIHAAAVSDYSIDSVSTEDGKVCDRSRKIDSDGTLTLKLKPNPKIIDGLRSMSRNHALQVIAFKLTNTDDPRERLAAVQKLAQRAKPNWIVHNDLKEISSSEAHAFSIFDGAFSQPAPVMRAGTKAELADVLNQLLFQGRPVNP